MDSPVLINEVLLTADAMQPVLSDINRVAAYSQQIGQQS
jgi:hypothetical protein